MKRILALVIAIFAVSLVLATPISAQDTEPVTTPITVDEAAQLLINAITAIAAGGLAGAPVTTFLVNVAKRIRAFDGVSPQTLQLVVGGILTALFWIAQRFGFEGQFQSVADLIVAAGPILLGLLATLSGSSVIFKSAVKAGDPVFGYQRAQG